MSPDFDAATATSVPTVSTAARAEGSGDPGVLAASGLVAGEGLAGVLVAGLVASGIIGRSVPPRLGGTSGELVALVLVLAVGAFLVAAGSPARRAPAGV